LPERALIRIVFMVTSLDPRQGVRIAVDCQTRSTLRKSNPCIDLAVTDPWARQRALGLTPRELEVLGFVREGMTNGEIATQLFVSPATVRSHLESAFAKIGAHTRTEAIARLSETGSAAGPGLAPGR
jgi:DNA-binding CsgD family transcriptional regulator